MRENKVIYGLIGYGGMGRWHTEILSNVPEIEIGGIYDIKEEKRIEAKEKGFSVYGSEEEMLSDPDIDVVLIATPNDCHKPIAIRAMHAGKNVISEKPVTLSSSDLQEMVNVAKETGKFLTVPLEPCTRLSIRKTCPSFCSSTSFRMIRKSSSQRLFWCTVRNFPVSLATFSIS